LVFETVVIRRLALLLVIAGCAQTQAPLEPLTTQPAPASTAKVSEPCTATLWVTENLAVYAGHDTDANRVGQLSKGTEFTVLAVKNGRMQFAKPTAFSEAQSEWVPLLTGAQSGWVASALVFVDLGYRYPPDADAGEFVLYTQPDTQAAEVVRWGVFDDAVPRGDGEKGIVKFHDCHGGWLKVDLLDATKTTHTGWLHPDNQCANQLTTCP